MEDMRTLSVFTENHIGLLHRVTSIFTRRHVNIESLTVSESEVKGIHRFTIVVNTTRELADKIAAQIERHVEVIKAFVHDGAQVIHRDLALYKVNARAFESPTFGEVIARHAPRTIAREPGYVVLEKTGTPEETTLLLEELEPFGVLEFVRSGSVALTRPMKTLSAYLRDLEDAQNTTW